MPTGRTKHAFWETLALTVVPVTGAPPETARVRDGRVRGTVCPVPSWPPNPLPITLAWPPGALWSSLAAPSGPVSLAICGDRGVQPYSLCALFPGSRAVSGPRPPR